MANCLESAYLRSYDAACRSGRTFLVGMVDEETGAPRSVAEFRVGFHRAGDRISMDLVQHMARENTTPSRACLMAMTEVLNHAQSDAVQRHLRLGASAVRALRRHGVSAITAREQETRLRALVKVLGEPSFEHLWKLCEQARITR